MAYDLRFLTAVASLFVALGAARLAAAETNQPKPDLTGVVKTKDGQSITGASIFIYTAGPRLGAGYL